MGQFSRYKKNVVKLESHLQGLLKETKDAVDKASAPLEEKERADQRALSRADRRAEERADGHSNGHSNGLKNGHSNGLKNGHPVDQSKAHSKELSNGQSPSLPFYWITNQQAKVLLYLINKKSRITRLSEIVNSTGVPYGTVRKSINTLVRERCISKPNRFRKGQYQGLTYTLNETLCQQFYDSITSNPRGIQSNSLTGSLDNSLMNGQSGGHSDGQSPFNSSSSFLYNKAATVIDINHILSNHPELKYWRDKGLTAKQINQWIKTAGSSSEGMIQYLCYFAFEMQDLGLEASKKINDVFSYFYKVIKETGAYRKPKGYKSYLDKERDYAKKLEKEAQEAKELFIKKQEAIQSKAFWEMMDDPESNLYKECFACLNDFEKNLNHKNYERSMRNAFDKIKSEGQGD